jgi:Fic family protein
MKTTNDRAGIYKKQKNEYSTFVPKPLPPDPPINFDNNILNLLSQANLALGRLDGTTEILPNPDLFVLMYLKKEAVLSSQIEGTQASLIDVLEFEAKALDPQKHYDINDVVNYIKTINFGIDQIKKKNEISIPLIKKIHYYLSKDTRGGERTPGELRSIQNWIGPPGCDISEATFIPPEVNDMKIALNDLEEFINKVNDFPPLIKAGLVHSQFETIHPFIDGNGRIGRLIITLMLMRCDCISRPILYLSYYFKQNRTEYYDRLQAIRTNGDWEKWLSFFLQGVYNSSTNAIEASRKIIELRKGQEIQIAEKFGNRSGAALRLYNELFNRPVIKVNSIVEISNISYQNANHLAKKFEKIGILKEVTGQKRNRIYEFKNYLDILNEGV